MHDNRNFTESGFSMEKLEEMQWSVVWQEDASETVGEIYTAVVSYVVWCRDLSNNEGDKKHDYFNNNNNNNNNDNNNNNKALFQVFTTLFSELSTRCLKP